MAWGLPDLKGALVGFYEENVKPTIDSKSTEYKELLKANFARGAQTQQAIIAIALGIFLLLALAFFWIDKPDSLPWKYLLLGSLTSTVSLYGLALKPEEFSQKLLPPHQITMNQENQWLNKKNLLILAAIIGAIALLYYWNKKSHE